MASRGAINGARMTSNQVRGLKPETVDEQAVAQYLQQTPRPLRAASATADAAAAAASAQRHHRLADRAPGRSAAREVPDPRAETGRVRARGARQQRAGRQDPPVHAPAAAHQTRAQALAQIEAGLREDFDAFHAVLVLPSRARRRGDRAARFGDVLVAGPGLSSFETLFAAGKPRCGQMRDTQREFLFGSEAPEHRLGAP